MNTNSRDLGIGAGKGDKSRVTSAEVFRARFPDGMGPKTTRVRSVCCEAPFKTEWDPREPATMYYKCLHCRNACDVRVFEIT